MSRLLARSPGFPASLRNCQHSKQKERKSPINNGKAPLRPQSRTERKLLFPVGKSFTSALTQLFSWHRGWKRWFAVAPIWSSSKLAQCAVCITVSTLCSPAEGFVNVPCMPGIYLWPAGSIVAIANSQSLASGRLASAEGLHQALCTPYRMCSGYGSCPGSIWSCRWV